MDNKELKEDTSIKAKQDYLKKEIIDKNFNQDKFIDYCLHKKENGDDLNCWGFEELQEAVQDFIRITTASKNADVKESEEMNVDQVEKMENYNAGEDKNFKDKIIQCKKLELTKMNNTQFNIILRNPKETEKGVFGQNFITYEVVTEHFGWSVTRRYSDFDLLRKILLKLYPGFNVPPLPNKKIGTRRFDTDFILKRMKFLELFLNTLIENESFKASETLVAFLSYQERDKFDNKMKEYVNFEPSSYVEEFRTLDGQVIVSHDDGNEKYFININKYFKLQAQIMNKLNSNLRMFYNNMNQATNNLEDIQKNYEILHVLNTRVLMKPQITKAYEELGVFCKNWRSIIIKQNEHVKVYMKEFFKYVNLEGQAYSALIAKREEMKAKYITENNKLISKKEKLWLAADLSKMELNYDDRALDKTRLMKDKQYAFENMCVNDNQIIAHLYTTLGYWNKMSIMELKKMIKKYMVKFVDNIKHFSDEFYPTLTDGIGTWQNLSMFVETA